MKTLVIYKSATGFTRKYAEWIAEAISGDLVSAQKVKKGELSKYDCIVFGGRLYATGIDGVFVITKNFEQIKDKHLFIFATGASPFSDGVLSHVRDVNFSDEQKKIINFYYYRGGFDYKGLPTFDRILMFIMKKNIERKKRKGIALDSDEIGMVELYDEPHDFTAKEFIAELVADIRAIEL